MDIRKTIDPDTWKSELYTQRHNHPQQKVVYIAGRIIGKPEYWEDFAEAAGDIEELGHIALNPADLPEGMTRQMYMQICISMIDCASVVLFLPGWELSQGANVEHAYCVYVDKPVAYSIEQLKELL